VWLWWLWWLWCACAVPRRLRVLQARPQAYGLYRDPLRVDTEALSLFRHLSSYVFAGIMAAAGAGSSAVDDTDDEDVDVGDVHAFADDLDGKPDAG
jgi:hypothetical protein